MRELFTSGVRYNLVYGGSRSGKTFEIVGTIVERALLSPNSRHLIVRQEGTSAKRAIAKTTWIEVMRIRFPEVSYKWNELYGFFELLGNGSQIWVGGISDDKAMEKLLGLEYSTIYMNEASECKYAAYTLLRSRLAETSTTISGKSLSQRFYVDLNPTNRQHWTYRIWKDGIDPASELPISTDKYGFVVVNPKDNIENLSAEYLEDLEALPPAARKRFFDGEYASDKEDGLWRRALIKRTTNPPEFTRIVVAIDPSVTNNIGSDETGIIAAGVDAGGNGYILADDSGKMDATSWARRAIGLLDQYGADRIVAEVNNGGDLVEGTIRAVREGVSYKAVRASRGKYTRAEPIAALYERGKIFHVGEFDVLEDQMCSFTTDFNRKAQGYSPDRVDALVWALTELFPSMTKKTKVHKPVTIPKSYSAFR